jgi:uncharacterized phosphosugar-binding protein
MEMPKDGDAAVLYHTVASAVIEKLRDSQTETIVAAARICADSISQGGLVVLFGTGHSGMMVDEMTPRQGCFVGFYPLVELALRNYSTIAGSNSLRACLYLEKYEGYAREIFRSVHFGDRDAFIIISTSGIRPVVVEMALAARERGLPVIAIVSRAHCGSAQPAHSSGKKLIDVADLVIDNLSPVGDCAIDLKGLEWPTGPLSTVTGAIIMNMIRCETASMLVERGHRPVMLPSHQFAAHQSAESQLETYYEEYRRSLKHLYE